MRVIEMNGNQATAEIGATTYPVRLDLIDDVQIGDYLIVHAGFAIEKLDEHQARENLAVWQEIARAEDNRRETREI